MNIFKTSPIPTLICRLAVGLIFLSEGIQKFITPAATGPGRFAKLGFADPVFWASFTACFEIVCGVLILLGFLTRLAAVPLLIIMTVAFIKTKWPLLIDKGFWTMAHEGRTDFAMTLLLLFLLIYGGGRSSVDYKIHSSTKQ